MKRCIAAVVLVITSMNAQGQEGFSSGNKLYDQITSSNAALYAYAVGYVSAVADVGAGKGATKGGWCFTLPRDATQGQLTAIVRRFLDANPQIRHLSASDLVEAALHNAFPCQK